MFKNGGEGMGKSANEIILKMQQLLDEKKEALVIIYDLTLKQKEDIETCNGDNLEKFIDKKQEQIDKIDSIDKLFNNVFEKLKMELKVDALDELNLDLYPGLKIIKSQILDITELGRKTIDLEILNKNKLDILINEIKKDIKRVRLGQKSINAYDKQNINADGIYIDKRK